MSEPEDKAASGAPKPHEQDIVVEHELLRLAGIDIERFRGLSDFEQRLVLRMAAQLVNADRRAQTDE
jgi:hypothetical protein